MLDRIFNNNESVIEAGRVGVEITFFLAFLNVNVKWVNQL